MSNQLSVAFYFGNLYMNSFKQSSFNFANDQLYHKKLGTIKDVSGFLGLKEYSEAYTHLEYLNISFTIE